VKVLITGGAGFIGSHLADLLLADGHSLRAFDNLEPQVHGNVDRPGYLDQRVELIRQDVRDRSALHQALDGVEAIFHFAANVGVGQSQYEIARYTATNVVGTSNLLDILANEHHTVRKLVVASSMSIYGEGLYREPETGQPVYPQVRSIEQLASRDFEVRNPVSGVRLEPVPTPESKPSQCESIYALNKRDQEEYCLLFGRTYGIPVVACRFFNTYGTRQSLNNPYTGAAAIFISRLRRGLAPLIYEDGHQQRDFVNVRDVARACRLVLESDAANGRTLNVGSGRPISILDLAEILGRISGVDVQPEVTGRFRKGDIRHCYADIEAIRALGFEPLVSLDEGLRELYEWSTREEVTSEQGKTDAELGKYRLLV
jgi:dTDP-L-rhamnose 4-epimerase